MEQLHPILPTQEQLTQWEDDWHNEREHADVLLIQAFQAGADAELEACCEWLRNNGLFETRIGHLRAARRPKQSLKQRALAELKDISRILRDHGVVASGCIRAALKELPD